MFKHILSIAVLIACFGCTTTTSVPIAPADLVKIIEVPGQSKDNLYVRTNIWFVENFNSAESVIQFSDKEAGRITGKYTFTYGDGIYNYAVKQNIDVEVKEGKARIKIYEPFRKYISSMGSPSNDTYKPVKPGTKTMTRVVQKWDQLADGFINHIKNRENENW